MDIFFFKKGHHMNTDDILIFLEIYKTKSISAAATSFFQTQSSISRRLALLEKELDIPLFTRGRGISEVLPTVAGDQFYPIALQMEGLLADAKKISRIGKRKRIRIAAPDSIVSYSLRRFFTELPLLKPDWEIEIIMADSTPICEMVRNDTIDFAIINGEVPFYLLEKEELFSEPYVVLASKTAHPEDTVSIEALDPSHEIYHVFGDEYVKWHTFWFPEGLAKAKVNLSHVAVDLLSDPLDWTILPLSTAQKLCPKDFKIYFFREHVLYRKAMIVTSSGMRSERKEITEELKTLLHAQMQ